APISPASAREVDDAGSTLERETCARATVSGLVGAGGVGVHATSDGGVIDEELERNDREDRGEKLVDLRDRDRLRRERRDVPIVLADERDERHPDLLGDARDG